MDLLGFLGNGQARRRALDEFVSGVERYIPPNLRPAAEFVAEANPVQGMMGAMEAGNIVFDPEQTAEARRRAAVDMGVEMAMTLAPTALVRMGYLAAPAGLAETFATPATEALNQGARNLLSDVTYAGRSVAQGDPQGVLEAFQRGGEAQSLSSASADDELRAAINQVQMYSPSLRAAENLKQNRGTYEQLRKMMLNEGAKADELSWSGADSVFKGKKVTKQEIIDYLADNTNMVEEGTLSASGKIGSVAPDPETLADQYVERMLENEIDYLRDEYIPNLIEDSELFTRVSDADPEMLDEVSRRTGKSVDDLLNFHDDEYIDLENSLRLRTEGWIVDEYYDVEEMARESLYDNAYYEASRDPEQFMIDYLGMDPDDVGTVGDTQYSEYFPKGARNYRENIYSYTDPTGKIKDDILPNASHFDDNYDAIIGHTRTGEFPLVNDTGLATDRNALLVGELQSDVGQTIRKYNRLPSTYEELVARSAYNEAVDPYRSTENAARFNAERLLLDDEVRPYANQMFSKADLNAYNAHLREKNDFDRTVPLTQFNDYKDMSEADYDAFQAWANENRIDKSRGRDTRVMDELASDLMAGNIEMSDVPIPMRKSMQEFIDARMNRRLAEQENIELRKQFNRIDPETGLGPEGGALSTSLPYVDKTPKWVDMMLRRNLFDAIKEGQEVMAVPNSEMVRKATYGSEEGQGAFYDEIVPKRFQDVVRRIDKTAKLEPMRIQTDTGVEDVAGLRLTPEFIQNAAKKGIPTWMIAGGVGLSGLMEYLQQKREEQKYGPRRSLLEL